MVLNEISSSFKVWLDLTDCAICLERQPEAEEKSACAVRTMALRWVGGVAALTRVWAVTYADSQEQ